MRVGNIFKDDHAQALAEFVLVFPIIMLVFLLIIQHLITVQASLVGNYAAYVACRVYAVRASLDPVDAEDKALAAASLAYAPVSRLMPGESGLPVGSPGTYLPTGAQGSLANVASLVEGYAVARYIRLNEKVSGGSVNINSSGAPAEVTVEINYAQPVLIPGLAELWKLTGGGHDIVKDLKPMRAGMATGAVYGIAGFYPSVNVRSKCAMGCEGWGSDATMYRPRKRKTVEFAEATNPALEQNARAQQVAQTECKAAHVKMQKALDELKLEQDAVDAAQAEYDLVLADPSATDVQKYAALTKLGAAQSNRDSKRWKYDMAKLDYEDKMQKLRELTKGPG